MFYFIDNLYYRFYRFVKALGDESIPRYNAVLLLSIFTMFNFIIAVIFLMIITGKIIVVDLPKAYLFAIGLLIIAINSYRVFRKDRYKIIEERFGNDTRNTSIKNNLLAVVYIILTILCFVVSLHCLAGSLVVKHVQH
ncbi:hypothetical protein LZZ85_04105 [Terrimonas sp. NA20]|uniref:Uncharacterized protein n=1 Tax=Terrimonas ginsenosidimutans TaxID=2908004 RepID=A0ABS9KMA0_9BACT|nr:hypothetical protein [Terrimonas ginsenosidimutans]MCG2613446.1 hypothetical protein [Terrimonas ginsenosidimutans]